MSAFGPSIVGGVAQSSVQAQQVGRALHRRQTDAAEDFRRVRDKLSLHLEALDEGDDESQLSELRIDGQLPEHSGQPASQEEGKPRKTRKPAVQPDAAAEKPAEAATVAAIPAPKETLYRHVDLTA